MTRKSIDLGLRLSSLFFILLYSVSLYLLTTSPEEITTSLDDVMRPLQWFRVPVTESVLTLTLALRFIPLVLEEVQNLTRSIQTRAIQWKRLGFKGMLQVWLVVADTLLGNLFRQADRVASAMQVRGFTSPSEHRVQWHALRLRFLDWLAIAVLVSFWCARLVWGW